MEQAALAPAQYLERPALLSAAVAYALHLHAVEHAWDAARRLYQGLASRGALHAVLQMARAAFLCARAEADVAQVLLDARRARALDAGGRAFEPAALGFFQAQAMKVRVQARGARAGECSPLATLPPRPPPPPPHSAPTTPTPR